MHVTGEGDAIYSLPTFIWSYYQASVVWVNQSRCPSQCHIEYFWNYKDTKILDCIAICTANEATINVGPWFSPSFSNPLHLSISNIPSDTSPYYFIIICRLRWHEKKKNITISLLFDYSVDYLLNMMTNESMSVHQSSNVLFSPQLRGLQFTVRGPRK